MFSKFFVGGISYSAKGKYSSISSLIGGPIIAY